VSVSPRAVRRRFRLARSIDSLPISRGEEPPQESRRDPHDHTDSDDRDQLRDIPFRYQVNSSAVRLVILPKSVPNSMIVAVNLPRCSPYPQDPGGFSDAHLSKSFKPFCTFARQLFSHRRDARSTSSPSTIPPT
jgi:hypothetical protein